LYVFGGLLRLGDVLGAVGFVVHDLVAAREDADDPRQHGVDDVRDLAHNRG